MSKVDGSFEGQSFPAIFAQGESVTIPDAHLMFCGQYSRQGHDLLLSGTHGDSLLVVDYFSQPQLADLISPDGATLKASVVNALAGPMNPGEYAQAGDQSAAASIGKVVNLEGTATVQHADGTTVDLKLGDPLALNDVLQTGVSSNMGVVFNDGTVFTLSGGSRMVLDNLVYQPGGSDNAMTLNVVQGTFAFVAGQVAPTGEMNIETPVATLGVRGTSGILKITSGPDGKALFQLIPDPADQHVGEFVLTRADGSIIGTLNTTTSALSISTDGTPTSVQVDATDPSATEIINQLIKSYNSASDSDLPLIKGEGDNDGNGGNVVDSSHAGDVIAAIVGGLTTAIDKALQGLAEPPIEGLSPTTEGPGLVTLTVPLTTLSLSQSGTGGLSSELGDNTNNNNNTSDQTAPPAPGVILAVDGGSSGNDGLTNDGTLDLSGVEQGATVQYSIDGGATWSPTFTAVEGVNTIQVRQIDGSNNISGVTTITFTLDTTAPTAPGAALANDSGASASDGLTNVASVALSGMEAGATVEYSTDGGATWSANFAPVEGVNNMEVRQVDAAGNPSSATSLSFTLDTSGPSAPGVTLVTDSGTAADGITNNGALNVTGVEAGASVQYSIDGGSTWSASFTAAEGANSVQVRQTDGAGNSSPATTFSFTLQTGNPAALGVTLVADTGTAGDAITNNGALSITGLETGATVQYSIDGGNTWTPSFTPVEGPNSIQVRQTDGVGNSSPATSFSFTLDTTVPAALGIALVADTGTSGDGITNNGALNITGLEAGATVQYSTDGGDTWSTTFTPVEGLNNLEVRQTDGAGNSSPTTGFSFTLESSVPAAPIVALVEDSGTPGDGITNNGALSITGLEAGAAVEYSTNGGDSWSALFSPVEGANNIQVRQTDAAGNSSPATSFSFTLDTSVPGAPAVALVTDSGIAGDGLTNNGALNITGLEAGAAVQYSSNGGDTWSSSFSPVEGANNLQVRQIDAAGNISTATSFSFTLDTEPPAAPNVTGFTDDTGEQGDGGVTNDHTLTLSGVTGEAGTARVEVFDGDTSLGFATIDPETSSWTFDTADLADGEHSFKARAIDAAGNASASSDVLNVDVTAAEGPNIIEGDDDPNTLPGTPGVDHIKGFGGADLITGHESNDILEGGAGADKYYWSEGDGYDAIIGDNLSQDEIHFQGSFYDFDFSLDGNDLTFGVVDETGAWAGGSILIQDFAAGGDTINFAEADLGDANIYNSPDREGLVSRVYLSAVTGIDQGSDLEFIFGSTGNDTMTDGGGTGRTRMEGGDGNDTITASGQSEMVLVGGNGNDELTGGGFDDNLRGSAGKDIIRGNPIGYEGEPDHDVVRYDRNGGSGPFEHGVFVNLSGDYVEMEFQHDGTTTVENVASGQALDNWWTDTDVDPTNNIDKIYDVEEVWGSRYDDVLIGNNHVLAGFAGNDQLVGTGESDTVNYYGFFADQPADHGAFVNLSGEAVTYDFYHDGVTTEETVQAGQALDNWWTDTDPENNVDTLQGIENVWGSQYDDVIVGNADSNYIDGGKGWDIIVAGGGSDYLVGGGGRDTFVFGSGNEFSTIDDFEIGTDEIHFTDGVSITDAYLYDSEDDDSDPDGTWLSLSNDSTVLLLGVTELIAGNYYGESLAGTEANEILFGAGDDDELTGNQGDDILVGGEGADTYYWSAYDGYDTIIGDNDGANQDIIQIVGGINDTTFYDYSFEIDGQDLIVGVTADDSYDFDTVGGALRIQDFFAPGGDSIDYMTADLGQNNEFYSPGGGDNDARIYFSAVHGTEQGDYYEVILGTEGDDRGDGNDLTDSSNYNGNGIDRLLGFGGNDTLRAGDGTISVLLGGNGDDILEGSDRQTEFRGGNGNDIMYSDVEEGDTGQDTLNYSRPATSGQFTHGVFVNLSTETQTHQFNGDVFTVGQSRAIGNWEILDGWSNGDQSTWHDTDTFGFDPSGGEPNVPIQNGIDNVRGSNFEDVIFGNDADNYLSGLGGGDSLYGGGGDDDLDGGAGNDYIDGGDGNDNVDYYDHQSGVDINLENFTATDIGGSGEQDVLVSIENVLGSFHDDIITGDDGDNYLEGRGGNDTIDGGEGWDQVSYGTDTDGVEVNLAAGSSLESDGSIDTLMNIQGINGSFYNDILIGDDYDNAIQGRGGDDLIDGGDGGDSVDFYDSPGDESNVGVFVDLDNDLAEDGYTGIAYDGFGGTDNIRNIENIVGSFHDDTLIGNDNDNYIEGRDGADTIYGESGGDTLNGGAGSDILDGGVDADTDFFVYENDGDGEQVDQIYNFTYLTDLLRLVDVEATGMEEIDTEDDPDADPDSTLVTLNTGAQIVLHGVTGVSDVSELIEQNNFGFMAMSFMASDPTGDPAARTMAPVDEPEPSDTLTGNFPAALLRRVEQGMNPNELALFQAVAAAAGLSIAQTQFASSAYADDTSAGQNGTAHIHENIHATPFAAGDGLTHYGLPSNLQDLNSDQSKSAAPDHAKPHDLSGFEGGTFHLRDTADATNNANHREASIATDTHQHDEADSTRTTHHEARHFLQDGPEAHKQALHEEAKQAPDTDTDDGPDAADCADDAVQLQGIDLSGLGPLVDMSALPALGLFDKAVLHHLSLHDGAALPNLGNVLDFSHDLFSEAPSPHFASPSQGGKPDGFAAVDHHVHVETNAPVDFLHHLAADMEAVAHHPG